MRTACYIAQVESGDEKNRELRSNDEDRQQDSIKNTFVFELGLR